jgi:tetratricopeptide (TPR) repeat protein
LAAAHRHFAQALAGARTLGDPWLLSYLLLFGWSPLAERQGDYRAARAAGEEALALARQRRQRKGMADILQHLGNLALRANDLDAARAYFADSVAIRRAVGIAFNVAIGLLDLARVAEAAGDLAEARALHREALALCQEGVRADGNVTVLEAYSLFTLNQGGWARGLMLAGAAAAYRTATGTPPRASDRWWYTQLESAIVRARQALGTSAAASAWAEGQVMALDEAIAYALGEADGDG